MSQLRRRMQNLLKPYKVRRRTYDAWLGDGNGNVIKDGKWMYARIRENVLIVFNNRVQPANNLPVTVGYDDISPNLLQVIGVRELGSITIDGNWDVGPHHETHEWGNADGGTDIVWVQLKQFLPLKVYLSSGLTIKIYGGYCYLGGWQYIVQQSLDMTSYVPASDALWAMVYIDGSGSVGVKEGSTKALNQLQRTDIPDSDPNTYPLAAIKMYAGQTTIKDGQFSSDIEDLRFAGFTSSGATGSLYQLALVESELDYALSRHIVG
ncbi:MAG: hypothetical protein KJ556_20285 [Gammaproteobacteria bacterium]|nr:hypothetical protein [Gammaproteobacteria bacterium]